MRISQIKIRGTELFRATEKDLATLESYLWVKLPEEYREFVKKLGEGVLGGSFIRVYPPWRVLSEITKWRDRIRRYWFWEKGRRLLPKERAAESIILADTLNGDEVAFHPMKPDRFFILPRYRETTFEVKGGFLETLEWMCTSGKLTRPFKQRIFEPFDSRKTIVQRDLEAGPPMEDNVLVDAVQALQDWAKKRSLTKRATEACRKWIAEQKAFTGNGAKTIAKAQVRAGFRDHALVFQPGKHCQPEVITTLALSDIDTGCEFGLYRLFTSIDGSEGSGSELYAGVAVALRRFLEKET